MKQFNLIVIILIGFLTYSCSSVTVNYDYDIEQDFSKYKTFKWIEAKRSNESVKNPLVKKRIRNSVDKILTAKGFDKKESGKADFLVIVHTDAQNRVDVTHWGYRYGPWYGPYGARTTVSHYKEGTIFIDIVDMEEKELVWRGTGTSIVKNYYSPEERAEAIEEAVSMVLENFPPPKE